MSKARKLSIVLTLIWVLVTVTVLFNLVYIEYPQMNNGFWLVFIRSVVVVSVLPPVIGWGFWWALKK